MNESRKKMIDAIVNKKGVSATEKLEELFKLWKEEQVEDKEYEAADYKYKGNTYKISSRIAKDSFTKDGIIDEDGWKAADKKKQSVLIIAFEANSKEKFEPEENYEAKRVDENLGEDNFYLKHVAMENKKIGILRE